MNKKGKLSASIMSADLDKISYFLTEFENAKLEFLHLDIMDGEFVPNLAIGTDYVKKLRKITNIPFDYHFLVNNPLKKMSWFDIRKGDHVSIHYENNQNIQSCIDYVKKIGAHIFIAINPETDFHAIDKYLNQIDGILVMHVIPGFAGGKLIPETIEKVQELKHYLDKMGFDLEIKSDGNVTLENAKILYKKGSTIFVSGTGLFNNADSMKNVIDNHRKVIGWK